MNKKLGSDLKHAAKQTTKPATKNQTVKKPITKIGNKINYFVGKDVIKGLKTTSAKAIALDAPMLSMDTEKYREIEKKLKRMGIDNEWSKYILVMLLHSWVFEKRSKRLKNNNPITKNQVAIDVEKQKEVRKKLKRMGVDGDWVEYIMAMLLRSGLFEKRDIPKKPIKYGKVWMDNFIASLNVGDDDEDEDED